MEVYFAPELEKRLNELAAQTGRPADELVQDAVAGYIVDLRETLAMLDRRYEDIKGGKVKLIPGAEVEAYFRQKYEAAKREQPSS